MVTKDRRDSSSRRLVEAALSLIDRGGRAGLSLRDVAAEAGCAHTNAYNWFGSFDALLWEAAAEAIRRQNELASRRAGAARAPRTAVLAFAEGLVEFAVRHPGWYRLIWLDELRAEPPEHVREALQSTGGIAIALVRAALPAGAPPAEAAEVTALLHGYLHGEICKLLHQRFLRVDADAFRARALRGTERLFRLLAGKEQRR